MKVLILGGLGFIGRSIVPRFLEKGCEIRIVDNLETTVHGRNPDISALTTPWASAVELVIGSITDREVMTKAIAGVDAIVHLAALTSIPESLQEPSRYCTVNIGGTALLCEILQQAKIKAFTLASSRAVYGEGHYLCEEHGTRTNIQRSAQELQLHKWDPACEICCRTMTPQKAIERHSLHPVSVYGLTKLAQENLVVTNRTENWGRVTMLRLQNVYGPGMNRALPDVGIGNIMAAQAIRGDTLTVFEDGRQIRDFVYIDDVAEVIVSSTMNGLGQKDFYLVNVGTGVATSISDLAEMICFAACREPAIRVSHEYRMGDVRNCVGDIALIRERMIWNPVPLKSGIERLIEWMRSKSA